MVLNLLNERHPVPALSNYPSAWVLASLSAQVPFKCPSAQVSSVRKCPSVLQVPKYLKCSSVRVLRVPKCCLSVLGVSLGCPSSPQWPLSAPLVPFVYPSVLWMFFRVKKVSNITGNGLLNSFVVIFKKFSEYIFYITLIVFYFLRDKMRKFYQIPIATCNHSKGFKNFPSIFYKVSEK